LPVLTEIRMHCTEPVGATDNTRHQVGICS
jgi:hypothetical protein